MSQGGTAAVTSASKADGPDNECWFQLGGQFGQGSAGCDEGGSSSLCCSISASRRRVRSSSWSRSGDGGLASSRRAILRSCTARCSPGSIVFRKPVVKRHPGRQGVERVRSTKLVGLGDER
jgi:hypothetical protein